MSENKQITKIANDINKHCPDLAECYCGDTHCNSCIARALYNAGYRKYNEGEWGKEEWTL